MRCAILSMSSVNCIASQRHVDDDVEEEGKKQQPNILLEEMCCFHLIHLLLVQQILCRMIFYCIFVVLHPLTVCASLSLRYPLFHQKTHIKRNHELVYLRLRKRERECQRPSQFPRSFTMNTHTLGIVKCCSRHTYAKYQTESRN